MRNFLTFEEFINESVNPIDLIYRILNPIDLRKIITDHKNYLDSKPGGKKADLRGANLKRLNLKGVGMWNVKNKTLMQWVPAAYNQYF